MTDSTRFVSTTALDLAPPSAERWQKRFLRIGHAGAGAYAPPNTLKSFALALDLGVDMVEFDVRPCRDALILLHDDDLSRFPGARGRARRLTLEAIRTIDVGEGERIPTLAEGIDLIKGRALMNVDLKTSGCEAAVLALLEEKGVISDALISSVISGSLRRVRQLAPRAQTGISYPRHLTGASDHPCLGPVVSIVLKSLRRTLPYRVVRKMARARADAAMLFHGVVSPATVERAHQAGRRVFVWTVDDMARLRQIQAMGVDGIASNRPALFARLE